MKCLIGMSSDIGRRIKVKRKELGFTQKNLAPLMGITFQQLQKYESGQSNISVTMLIKLCKIFKVDITYFILKNSNNSSLDDSQSFTFDETDILLENQLVRAFRSIKNKRVKEAVTNLIKTVTKSE